MAVRYLRVGMKLPASPIMADAFYLDETEIPYDQLGGLIEADWTEGQHLAMNLGLKVSWQWLADASPKNGFYLIPSDKISWGIKYAMAGPFESVQAAIIYLLEDVTDV